LSQKDLTTQGVSNISLGWGGAELINGFGEHIPYDLMFGSDVDTDVDNLGDVFILTDGEDYASHEDDSSEVERTSYTSTSEYPQAGYRREYVTDEIDGLSRTSTKLTLKNNKELKKQKDVQINKKIDRNVSSDRKYKKNIEYGYSGVDRNQIRNKSLDFHTENISTNPYRKNLEYQTGNRLKYSSNITEPHF
jgi:hypothetical protein